MTFRIAIVLATLACVGAAGKISSLKNMLLTFCSAPLDPIDMCFLMHMSSVCNLILNALSEETHSIAETGNHFTRETLVRSTKCTLSFISDDRNNL